MIARTERDERYIRRALRLAAQGKGLTSPNPAVGAVIVERGRVAAEGFHRKAGGPHAEVEALRALRSPSEARGATLYVTLEPCSTTGRTPPCVEAIIAAGIRRVVYGATDPNPAHTGRADGILKNAGVEVTPGVLAEECSALNLEWNHWITTGIPFVTAKYAMSLDGRISSHPESRWITSSASRADAMRLRAGHDAVFVGAETVRRDNPRLTVRGIAGARQPLRVIWSPGGELPDRCHILSDAHRDRTVVVSARTFRGAMRELGRRGVTSVLVEGGGRTLGAAFDARLVRRVRAYLAPCLIGGPVPAVGGRGVGSSGDGLRLEKPVYRRIGDDVALDALVALDRA